MHQRAPSLAESYLNDIFHLSKIAVSFAMLLPLIPSTTQPAQAQTYQVLHYFTSGADGAKPIAGATVGGSGILYGTAPSGGTGGYGTAYKLTQHSSSWVFSPLYEFTEGGDGVQPVGGVVVGSSGALYGTAVGGGSGGGGTVFELRPPFTICRTVQCYWTETTLYSFSGAPSDGALPWYEDLIFDSAGNIYGTTKSGGTYDAGTAFKLTQSGDGWTETVLHSFGNGTDGAQPWSSLVFDASGTLYGTTIEGGSDSCGTVYQLSPSGGSWTETVLVNLSAEYGCLPMGALLIGQSSGNLYGTASEYGPNGGGTVFKLVPSNGGWTMSTIYPFTSCLPTSGVSMDSAGNLYGTCYYGASGLGSVFELTNCSQTCTLIDLHDFNGSDGQNPWGSVALDASGNIHGTTFYGGNTGGDCGNDGCGVVWEITP